MSAVPDTLAARLRMALELFEAGERLMCQNLKRQFPTFYDDSGAIGRRYRRMDEAGTPFCCTVDGQTAADGTVTVRLRDEMTQVRVHQDQLAGWIRERLA